MDVQIQPARVGIGQIDADGRLVSLNAEFARLFDLEMPGALNSGLDLLPPGIRACWHELVNSTSDTPGPRRWTVTAGAPPDYRLFNVVGWASPEAGGAVAVQLFVGEIRHDQLQSLGGVAERARLAREIHDGLAQDLWLAKLAASKLARHRSLDDEARGLANELVRSIDAGLEEAQTAIFATWPAKGTIITLSELVTRQVEEFSDRFGIRVDCDGGAVPSVPPHVSIEVLRVLQEALTNVRKHANARSVRVTLTYVRGEITLLVRDDGTGFDPAIVTSGYGRRSMRERASSIGARLAIASSPGRGSTVTLQVPARR